MPRFGSVTWPWNPAINKWDLNYVESTDNSWKIAPAYQLKRVDTMRQITHLPESGIYSFWRWASTEHLNVKRIAWQGGSPPFRVRRYLNGVLDGEITWVRTQSSVNPAMYEHTYPEYGYEHRFQPNISANGTTLNYSYVVDSQDGQQLIISAPTQVDNSRFKYFDDGPAGSDAASGTFNSPYKTFGHGYASVTNPQNYIYCFKAGTYQVHNGTPMNDAALNDTHCKSYVGIEDGFVLDMSEGNFSKGASDLYFANFATIGGRADKENVRQFDLDQQCLRCHAHKVTINTTVTGTIANDNPAGFMFWDLDGTAFHENLAFTECVLANTALSQFAVFFRARNLIIENFTSNTATTAANGGQHVHLKDACQNVTIRHSTFQGQSTDGMFNVASQDWANCSNVDIHFFKIVNTEAGTGEVSKWNVQAHTAPMQNPPDYYVQRGDVDAYQASPFTFINWTNAGDPVHYTGIRWESTNANFAGGENATTTGSQSFETSTVKVADINSYDASDLGLRGGRIFSTLVT